MQFDTKEEIQKLFKIETKDRKVVQFFFNEIQTKYYAEQTTRDLVLKARQMGMTSMIVAIWLMECILKPNTNAVIISHEGEATARALAKAKFYIEHLPLKPQLEYASKSEMTFPKTNSRFYIGTAGSKAFGRGDTITNLHVSEIAFWEKPDLLVGLFQAVPKSGKIVIESTANGWNHFRQMWYESSNFKKHFYPWFDFREYSAPLEAIDITSIEEEMMEQYGIDAFQIMWRRQKIEEFQLIPSTYSSEELFQQEYPASADEAFLITGNSAFSQKSIISYKTREPMVGNLIDSAGVIKFEPNEKGLWNIYQHPDVGGQYVIGADVSEGLEGGDFSSATVLDDELVQVATIKSLLDVKYYGDELLKIAKYYNQALLGVESNNQGLAVLQYLRGYNNLYHRTTFDEETQVRTKKMGWRTDGKTKPMMISELAPMIRQHQVKVVDKETKSELMSYINNNGKFEAQSGSHDDLVIALALAVQMNKEIRPRGSEGHRMTDEEVNEAVNIY